MAKDPLTAHMMVYIEACIGGSPARRNLKSKLKNVLLGAQRRGNRMIVVRRVTNGRRFIVDMSRVRWTHSRHTLFPNPEVGHGLGAVTETGDLDVAIAQAHTMAATSC